MEMTAKELKDMCRSRSLKLGGKKQDLVHRLLEAEAEDADDLEEKVEADEDEEDDDHYEQVGEEELDKDAASWKGNPTKMFVEALERDEIDEEALEEIFRLQRPKIGEVVKGQVSSIVEFGAFVELEGSGWTGLIHISEISDTYVEQIEDYIQPGQNVEAMVIKGGTDRLDRLSLSLRRLQDPTSLDTGYRYATSTLLPPGRSSNVKIPLSRRDPIAEALRRMEVRIGAIEGVLLQLGHGQALRAAQEEARAGVTRPVVPPMETLLSGIPNLDTTLKEQKLQRVEKEQSNIDDILSDMMGDSEEVRTNRAETRGSRQVSKAAPPPDDEDVGAGAMMSGVFGAPSGEAYEDAVVSDDANEEYSDSGFEATDPQNLADTMGEKFY